jgi:4-hydroxy-2-oxoglutarate aldolase
MHERDDMTETGLDLCGIFPPIPTPFDDTGAIDSVALRRNLEFLGRFDLRGVVALGSNGEAVHLNDEDRARLVERTRRFVPRDRLLIVGTGHPSTQQTIEASKRAASLGADAVLVLPPHYYKGRMTLEALKRHFHMIADACSAPVVLYNMPACTGLDLDLETLTVLASHPHVIGLKDSGGNVAKLGALHERLGSEFQILAGSAGFLLPALSVGAIGGVLALANVAPALCLAVWEQFRAGDIDRASKIQTRLIEANDAVTRRWGVPGLKAAMDLLGLDGGSVRAPLLDLAASDIEGLRMILATAGILESPHERSHDE